MFRKSKSSIGGFVAHLGLATLMGGLILSRGLEQQERTAVHLGETVKMLGYTLAVQQLDLDKVYDRDSKLPIIVTTPPGTTFTATPGLYFQRQSKESGEPDAMVWPYIRRYAAHDFYLSLAPPVSTAWEKPQSFAVGESKTLNGITVKYRGIRVKGTPGTASAVFYADLPVATEDGTVDAAPSIGVAGGPKFARINNDLLVSMLSMNAADRSAQLQVFFASPLFPIEIFTKPLTGLVWGGAGILTLGGLIAAYSRRRAKVRARAAEPTIDPEPDPIRTDAPLPAS